MRGRLMMLSQAPERGAMREIQKRQLVPMRDIDLAMDELLRQR